MGRWFGHCPVVPRVYVAGAGLLLAVIVGCASAPAPVAESRTCDAVRALHRDVNTQHEDTAADERRTIQLEERVATVARDERPSEFMVKLATAFARAAHAVRKGTATIQPDDRVQVYSNALFGLYAVCELPPGVPLDAA